MKNHAIAFLALSSFLAGCPFVGDCWGDASISVTLAEGLSVPRTAQVLVAEVVQINASDVTGTSTEGLPIGPAAREPRILEVAFGSSPSVGQADDGLTDPYPTWFYAFVDLNDNRHLDPGEPFGTDPHNPSSVICGTYNGTIVIDQALTSQCTQR